jgi:hypothetical protein
MIMNIYTTAFLVTTPCRLVSEYQGSEEHTASIVRVHITWQLPIGQHIVRTQRTAILKLRLIDFPYCNYIV